MHPIGGLVGHSCAKESCDSSMHAATSNSKTKYNAILILFFSLWKFAEFGLVHKSFSPRLHLVEQRRK